MRLSRKWLVAMRSMALAGFALATLPADSGAQLQSWRVGGAGLSFTSQALSQSGALEIDGGLQPLELQAGQNLIELLRASGLQWLNGQPPDFTAPGQPRTWSNDGLFNQVDGPLELVDGNPSTSSLSIFKAARNQAGAAFFWDLGAPFPINRIRFFPDPNDPDAFINGFQILVNDGESYNDINRPDYQLLRRVEVNRDMVVDIDFAPLQGRYLQLVVLSKAAFNLAEFEIYGVGFVPVASYESELHSFGSAINLGDLRLHATRLRRLIDDAGGDTEADAPAAVLQLRTGADDTPRAYFRRDRDSGAQEEVSLTEFESRLPRRALFRQDAATGQLLEEVDRSAYADLPVAEQGPVRDFVQGDVRGDVDNWSPWSPPLTIDTTGFVDMPVGLPGPREYLQFRLNFIGDADNAIRIDSLQVEFSPGLVSNAIGEVALASDPRPVNGVLEVQGGIDTTFTYDIRTEFSAGESGYRGLRLEAFPAPVFGGLLRGDTLTPVDDLVVEPTASGFDVLFAPVTAANNEPLRVLFNLRLLEHNTPVHAWLLGEGDAPPHPIRAGDANQAVTTGVINAFTVETRAVVGMELRPSIITPNGDGRNDLVSIQLVLAQFAADLDIDIEIFDFAGHRVRKLVSTRRSAGAYDHVWDGRNDGGSLVPPGIYILRTAVISDAQTFESSRTIGVAY
ncbi:MAG: gliding motility-associated C-terminal domain-containing protein [bacterium]|nr:gliding motility-associated C-terminal domain-containing protein [bacterium]